MTSGFWGHLLQSALTLYVAHRVVVLANYSCMTFLHALILRMQCLQNILWEASKVYSSVSSHCMNFTSLHLVVTKYLAKICFCGVPIDCIVTDPAQTILPHLELNEMGESEKP